MLIADTLKDYVRTIMQPIETALDAVSSTLSVLEAQGRQDLLVEGIPAASIVLERFLDLRYVGQSYELTIPFMDDLGRSRHDFHAEHERRFGYADPNESIQVVNVRLKARGITTAPALAQQEAQAVGTAAEPRMTHPVVFAGQQGPVKYDTPVFERADLKPGCALMGPAIITQYDTTTVVPPGWHVQVDAAGNLIIEARVE